MPLKNKLTLAAFIAKFSSEKACHEYLAKKRWPNGFVCSSCKGTHSWMLADGKYECSHCHKQVSVTAGTVMHRSHIPLTKWFLAFYLVMSDKRGISAVELSTSIVFFGTTRPANGFRRARPFREAAAWCQNCTRNNVQGFVWIGTDSGFYVAHPTRSRLLGGYFASADREGNP